MLTFLKNLADNTKAGSLADRLRKKRFALFLEVLAGMPKPIRIIDVGGTELFWERMGFIGVEGVHITLLNLVETEVRHQGFISVQGDGTDLSRYNDKEFDMAFSNSVIEHVGSLDDQRKMASEIRRVARRYFVQTPNRYFPLEPHFLFPFFQFLPDWLQVRLLMNFSLGWYRKTPDKEKAHRICRSIRLLSRAELCMLFPRAEIHKESFFGCTKSFIVLGE